MQPAKIGIGVAALVVAAVAGVGMMTLLGESDEARPRSSSTAVGSPTDSGSASQPDVVTFDDSPAADVTPGASAQPRGDAPVASVDATPGEGVSVSVLQPDGSAAAAATVVFEAQGSKTSLEWTPANSAVSLKPGLYTVRASANDKELRSEAKVLTLRAGEAPPALRLQLMGRTGLAGRVEGPPGESDSQFYVWTLRLDGALNPEKLRKDGDRKKADKDGTFRMLDLRPGTYAVGAGRAKGAVDVTTTVVVDRGGLARVDLLVPSLDSSRVLIVRVLGPDGEVVTDAKAVGDYKTEEGKGKKARAVRKEDGSLWLVPEQGFLDVLSGATAGEAYVRVSSDQYGEQTIPLSPGSSLSLTVRFEGAAVLVVEVSGYEGSALEGDLKLELVRLDSGGEAYGTRERQGGKRKVDPSGKETIGPVQPGDYELQLLVKEDGKDRVASTNQLRLQPGENAFTLSVPQLSSLTVVTDDESSLGLIRLGGGGKTRRKEKPEDGKVVFDRLLPGEYQIVRWSKESGASSMNVSVNGATQVSFEGSVANSLLVHITDPAGSLGTLGLRSGDKVVGFDGEAFKSTSHMRGLLSGASDGSHTLTVMRGGGRLELSLDDVSKLLKPKRLGSLKKLMKPGKGQGGWFEVTTASGS
jgi:hypothetical protein